MAIETQQFLANLPYRFMIVDDIMMPIMANRKGYSTFGVRPQENEEESLMALKQAMDTDEMFIRMLSD